MPKKTATISDVAKRANVGVGTVSRVINGGQSVSKKTIEKVNAIIAETGFIPNANAQKFRSRSSKLIALMVPIVYHPFYAALIEAVERELDKAGYRMLLVASQRREQKESEIIKLIKAKHVDGAIFVTHYPHSEEEVRGCAIVSIDRNLGDEVPVVTSDNFNGTLAGLNHLKECGCGKIAYLGGKPDVSSSVNLRKIAYEAFVKENGFQTYLTYEHCHHGDERLLAKKLLDTFPEADGIFAAGYQLGIELIKELHERNIKVPEEKQVVVYDGAFSEFEIGNDLTAVAQPIDAMAEQAVRLLIDQLKGKKSPIKEFVLNAALVKGRTTK
ncbi:MAG: LacI family DNA-binding transcriptional regulator [Bacilli bacterium]|nr:LacI family DNA-binding transcriptional regulator [Bacilli bacterium]